MKEEKTIESKQLYKGKVVQLRVDTVSLSDGGTKIREIVVHPGAAAIVALMNEDGSDDEDKEMLLVEQYRKAIERKMLEIPTVLLRKASRPMRVLSGN